MQLYHTCTKSTTKTKKYKNTYRVKYTGKIENYGCDFNRPKKLIFFCSLKSE